MGEENTAFEWGDCTRWRSVYHLWPEQATTMISIRAHRSNGYDLLFLLAYQTCILDVPELMPVVHRLDASRTLWVSNGVQMTLHPQSYTQQWNAD